MTHDVTETLESAVVAAAFSGPEADALRRAVATFTSRGMVSSIKRKTVGRVVGPVIRPFVRSRDPIARRADHLPEATAPGTRGHSRTARVVPKPRDVR